MSSAHENYQRHLRNQLLVKGYAVWPPGRVLQLGDIGVLGAGGDFQKRTDLWQLGVEPKIEEGPKQPMSATSHDVRQALVRASADVASSARGVLGLRFDKKGTTIFEVRDFQHIQIGNMAQIAERVLKLWDKGKGTWKRSWCLVDQVWRASAGTIIVSLTSNVQVHISAEASGTIPGVTALADPEVAARVEVRGDGVTKVIGGRDLTPMFTCMALNYFESDLKRISTGGMAVEGEEKSPRLVRLELDEVEAAWRTPGLANL
jgi:hypothetical protein